ncbi:MAG TPA: hypothetical protein VFV38_50810 [Ktedonobacteraceae bacterium]|nr:hypothetical protein [Ktedonobacteraceae bacterium]
MMLPVTKTVQINRNPMAVFAFLANGENWPKFAIHNIHSILPGTEGDWVIETPRGPGLLRLKTVASLGIVDHEFIDPQEGRWEVPARVVSASGQAVFMMTLSKPERMSERDFQAGLTLVDEELATLKRVLEAE